MMPCRRSHGSIQSLMIAMHAAAATRYASGTIQPYMPERALPMPGMMPQTGEAG